MMVFVINIKGEFTVSKTIKKEIPLIMYSLIKVIV